MTGKAQPESDTDTDVDVELLEYVQTLSIAERLRRHAQMVKLVRALRTAGKELHGFDPSAAAATGLIKSKRAVARPKDLRVATELELIHQRKPKS